MKIDENYMLDELFFCLETYEMTLKMKIYFEIINMDDAGFNNV